MPNNGVADCAAGGPGKNGAALAGVPAGAPPSFGVIITNRDRVAPMRSCLGSLSAQRLPPAWVVLSDLGSREPHRSALAGLADQHQASYLRIDHPGGWNKPLAFNTAFRLALRRLPGVSHVIQLDADMVLHPDLLERAASALSGSSAFCCLPRSGPRALTLPAQPGDRAGYERALRQCGPVLRWAVGVFMVLPCGWLEAQRGFDEGYAGWGHEDTDLWWRANRGLACRVDGSGAMLIHQWHPRQAWAGQRGPNWPRFVRRMANPDEPANPDGWGAAPVSHSVLRHGLAMAPSSEARPARARPA